MKRFVNFKIATKLIIGFLIVACIASVVGVVGLVNINTLAETDKVLYEGNTLGIVYAGNANTYYQRLRYNVAEMLLLEDNTQKDAYIGKMNDFISAIDSNLKNYESGIITQTDRDLFNSLKTDWDPYKSQMQQVIQLAGTGQYAQMKKVLLTDSDTLSGSLMDAFVNLYQYNADGAAKRAAENTQLAKTADLTMIITVLVAMIVAVLLGVFLSRNISKPLGKMVTAADKLAQGDFEIDITTDSKDEIGMLAKSFRNMSDTLRTIITDLSTGFGAFADCNFAVDTQAENYYVGAYYPLLDSLRKMRDTLSETMRHIGAAAEQVMTGSEQVSSGAQALASGSTEQAATVEELNASVTQVAEQADANLSTIGVAAGYIEQAGVGVNASNEYMRQLTEAMAEISSSSSQIASITKVIEDIAFQTNILALNAAIEAARAGTAGKGFAVVADEVRNLAAKSGEAAHQTSTLIAASVAAVERGTQITEQTAAQLQDTGVNAEKVTKSFATIEQASTEQTGAIDQIKDGLSQISAVVQTNAATAEENSATSEEMSAQAVALRKEVGKFRLADGAAQGNTLSTASPSEQERANRLPEPAFSLGKY
ncbi:methyl-accepting chemotaxis protein [Caproiciproducens sp.]